MINRRFSFITGLAISLLALPLAGTEDVERFGRWMVHLLHTGVFAGYVPIVSSAESALSLPDYPPLALALLYGLARSLHLVGLPVAPDELAVVVGLKVTTLLAMAITMYLVRSTLHRQHLESAVEPATAGLWLNLALVLNGPVLGYLDAWCWAPGVAALMCLSNGWTAAAALLAASSALVKPQGLFFAFVVMLAVSDSRRLSLRVAVIGCLTALVVSLPFAIASGPWWFARGLGVNVVEDTLSGYAFNAWWLVTVAVRVLRDGWTLQDSMVWLRESELSAMIGVWLRPWTWAAVLYLSLRFGARLRGTRDLASLCALAALVAHVYRAVAIGAHENHAIYVVPPLAIAAAMRPAYRRLFAAVSTLAAMNMLFVYGLGRDFAMPWQSAWFAPVSVALSLANLAVFVTHVRRFRAEILGATPARLPASPASPAIRPA